MSGLGLPVMIRPWTRNDLRKAAGVMHRSAALAYRDINWHADEERVLQAFADRAEDKWTDIQVAASVGDIVGVMCLEGSHVDQLFIEPDWQGRGLGRQLLDHAARIFPDGYTLDVFVNNEPALQFYLHLGLEICDEFDSPLEGEREYRLRWLP